MPIIYSFNNIIRSHYFELIKNEVTRIVESPSCRFNIHSRSVENINKISVSSIELRSINPYDSLDDKLIFAIDVEVKLELFGFSYGSASKDKISKWLNVVCEVKLRDGFKDFQIRNVSEFCKPSQRSRLDDSLIPYIHDKDLDKQAEGTLKKYYSEALLAPTRIDVRLFAGRLGLKIEEACLSKDNSILGQMIFHDCEVKLYEPNNGCIGDYKIKGGTILVDSNFKSLRTVGSWNNTVIHECVHWLKHRKAFELIKMYNGDAGRIACRVMHEIKYKQSDKDWMEWQANSLAPRILMPYTTFKQKADEIITQYNSKGQINITSDVIYDLASFFGVSAQSAKIRLVETGYKNAIGILEYVDNRYVKGYSFEDDSIKKNQTFSIPIKDALKQYTSNPDFKRVINSGNFIYIDSHYCINAPQYLLQNEYGVLEMTDYARRHMNECCLVFTCVVHPSKLHGTRDYSKQGLYHSVVPENVIECNYEYDDINRELEERAKAIHAEMDEVLRKSKLISDLPASFSKSLIMLMDWQGLSNEELADKSKVSVKTIQRMRNNPSRNWSLELVVSVCIGLQLPPYISYPLIGKAGINLTDSEKDIVFSHVVSTQFSSSINEVNEYLKAAGYSIQNRSAK